MKIHDYTQRYWGHDYYIIKIESNQYLGDVIHAGGWGKGLKKGNFILLVNEQAENKQTRYKIRRIEYLSDPPDMWKAILEHAPRPNPVNV